MLKKILPQSVYSVLESRLNLERVYEIRLRGGKPILVNYGGTFYHISENGISKEFTSQVLHSDAKLVENVVYKAGEYSLYAVNHQIKQGFITVTGGIRIGICGELVEENAEIKTLKNFSSVNIRIPHEVKGCALTAYKYITLDHVHNTLILSPPGCGKTTFLRDLARNFSMTLPVVNTLVLDERCEIAASKGGVPQLDVGMYSDVLSNCTKTYGFLQGVRVMRPDLIITDELAGAEDLDAARLAISSGIKIIASAHAKDLYDLTNKAGFEDILKRQLFTRFVVISDRRGPGTYEGIYDENMKSIYFSGA